MSSRKRKSPRRTTMMVTGRNVTLRDFAIFQLKLGLDGLKDMVVFSVSIVAVVLDFIAGRGQRPRLFYSVVRASERFDKWLNLHGVMERLDEGDGDDGFFGASDAGADSLIGKIEELVRGGDEPRGKRKGGSSSSPEIDDLAELGDLDDWGVGGGGADEGRRG